MSLLDLKRNYPDYFVARRDRLSTADSPDLWCLTTDKPLSADVDSSVFPLAWEGLYQVAVKVKHSAASRGQNFVVMPVEALWQRTPSPTGGWSVTLMIRQPHHVTQQEVDRALEYANRSKPTGSAVIFRPSLASGAFAQLLHPGPHADRAETLQSLDRHMSAAGFPVPDEFVETYLNDSRRVAADRCRTIIRKRVG